MTIAAARLPFNFQLGADRAKIALRAPYTPEGELEVRIDGCAGDLLASLPLSRATLSEEATPLSVVIPPRTGRHDLCLMFTARSLDPMWAIEWVRLDAPVAGGSPLPPPPPPKEIPSPPPPSPKPPPQAG